MNDLLFFVQAKGFISVLEQIINSMIISFKNFLFKSVFLAALLSLIPIITACQRNGGDPVVITPDGDRIRIELAISREDRQQGLMFREQLDEDAGMLFVFEKEQNLSFWMKDTLIPLDILYINDDGEIVDIKTMQPCPADTQRCPTYPSRSPAQYGLELNAGQALALELKIGDQLDINIPRDAQPE